eukprot:5097606-Alexandrium_andersonii.AAC.1
MCIRDRDYLRKKAGVPTASSPAPMPAPTPGAAAPAASSPAPAGAKAQSVFAKTVVYNNKLVDFSTRSLSKS